MDTETSRSVMEESGGSWWRRKIKRRGELKGRRRRPRSGKECSIKSCHVRSSIQHTHTCIHTGIVISAFSLLNQLETQQELREAELKMDKRSD